MKYSIIITLLLLSFVIVSSIPFDDAFAENVKVTITSDKSEYYTTDTIKLKCIPDPLQSINISWIFKDSNNKIVHWNYIGETEYSLSLAGFPIDEYKVSCGVLISSSTTNPHISIGDSLTFSIVPELIVDLAAHPQITNYVDINYNPTIHNVTIEWDFGIQDNRTCYTKTDFGIDYMINGTLTHDPYHTFFGDDITLYDVYSMFNDDIVNEDMAVISCEGEISFNITDFELLNDFSGFEFWMTFYEKINDTPYILNEITMIYSEDIVITPYSCSDSTIDLHTSIYYDVTKHLKITDTDMFTNQCDTIVPQYDGIIPVSYTSVDSIIYEEYPPHNTHTPQSTHNTHNTHNTEKKNNNGSGCSGDCTAPTIGVDKNGVRFVKDGLKLNDVTFEGNYFKTHMPMQYTEIGKVNHLELKVYENSGIYNIEKIQFAIVKEIGSPINLAEPRIEIDVSNFANDINNPSLDGFTLIDKEEIIDYSDVTVSTVLCMDNSNQECLKLDIYWSFAKVPEFNVLAINGWDNNKNSFTTYFNDGLSVVDPNYVEPEIIQPYKYVCNDPSLDSIMNGGDRNNCNWRAVHMGWLYK